jgi:osmoprotectant transport system ATP-binding protein
VSAAGAPLRIEHLVVRYPGSDRNAVDDVSLDLPGGGLVVLLGPSGCGKSTLLRTINRLVTPASGRIELDGRDVATVPPTELRRGIGYVIQAVGLFPHLTVAQNIAVVPDLLNWRPARTATRVDELLEMVRLDPARYRGRYPRELSGGEAQRVGVARAIAAEPRLLLMDEPFGAVDAIVRLALQDETARIQRALGTTIIFVTHDVDEALRIADRIVVMEAGRVVQFDTPLQMLAHPASPYVEQLLDTRDAVRRLALLHVRDAMRAGAPAAGAPQIDAGGTLRDALTALLDGADALAVVDGGTVAGTLAFDDVRRAIAQSAA